jgi:hypothetical protein
MSIMQRHFPSVASILLAAAMIAAPAAASPQKSDVKYKTDLPPSAELNYAIKAKESGLTLRGESKIDWQTADNTYSVAMETRAMIVGKIHQARSEGIVNAHGLAPVQLKEKRFRKPENSVIFDREDGLIRFSLSDQTYPITGGEQDRTSAIFQLVSIARGNPAEFKEGSSWTYFVAGRNDGEPWTFNVGKQETIRTPMGNIKALHVVKKPPPDAPDRKIDLWLAPSLEWYPVRIRFTDNDTEYIEQTLEAIAKK